MSEKPITGLQLGSAAVLPHRPADPHIKAQCCSRNEESRYFSALTSLCVCLDVFTSRWWAWTLIKGLSPEETLQVRAKVASLEALKGHRADLGLQRAWEGNYMVSTWEEVQLCTVVICLKKKTKRKNRESLRE